MKRSPPYHEIWRRKHRRAGPAERKLLEAEFQRYKRLSDWERPPDLGTFIGTRRLMREVFLHPPPPLMDEFQGRNWRSVEFDGSEWGEHQRRMLGAPSHAVGAVIYRPKNFRHPTGLIWRRALHPKYWLWLIGLWAAYPFRAWARARLLAGR